MGFLEAGTPLPWADALKHIPYIRKHGIEQFLITFERVSKRQGDVLKWGDEIEYHLVRLDRTQKSTAVSLIAPEVVHVLEEQDKTIKL
jgi:glutamate--cysteine ligase catalytic subunit